MPCPRSTGNGKELDIKELAELEVKTAGYHRELRRDGTKPNGMPLELLDVFKSAAPGRRYGTDLENSLRLANRDFLNAPVRKEHSGKRE